MKLKDLKNNQGVYISYKAEFDTLKSFKKEFEFEIDKLSENLHLTLMYSKVGNFEDYQNIKLIPELTVNIIDVECFKEQTGTYALVLRVKETEDFKNVLNDQHEKLIKLGLKHGYPSFNPHVTIKTKLDKHECDLFLSEKTYKTQILLFNPTIEKLND